MINDGHHLATGYGTYGKELLSRLQNTGKYEIAELACFSTVEDAKRLKNEGLPWKFYANHVSENDPRINDFKSHPANAFGKWRFEHVCLDFKPDIVCTPPGEMVLTIEGYKKIEEISIGEYVLSHTGKWQRVTKTFKRQYKGELYYVYINGKNTPLKLTPNHPVLIYKKKKQTNKKKSILEIYKDESPEFVPVQDIKSGDMVVTTNFNQENVTNIDITEYLEQFYEEAGLVHPFIDKDCNNHVVKNICADKNFGCLIGYILSDGHISNRGVNITFGINEEDFCKHAIDLFASLGLSASYKKTKDKECYDIRCNSVILAKFLKNYNYFYNLNKEFAKGIIQGLVRGDGCYKSNEICFDNTNKQLAYNYRTLCTYIGIRTTISFEPKKGNNGSYSVRACGEDALKLHLICLKKDNMKDYVDNAIRRCNITNLLNNNLISSIKSVRKVPYRGQVYNIEVENDNSYLLEHICVHNCDIRDPWMLGFVEQSPYRKFFHWHIMPTVDSAPQNEAWLETFMSADSVFTYSEWGQEVLKEQCGTNIKLCGVGSCGVDTELFKPSRNKRVHKDRFNLNSSCNIIGTVMRNQKRKLYPDLMDTFNKYIDICKERGDIELAQNTFLYLHTAYPDMGWNIPDLLKKYGLSHKTLFTYICRNCNYYFPSFFKDVKSVCPRCNNLTAMLPNTSFGLTREQLSDVYNLFDVYVQYATCLTSDQEILTKEGWKEISKIKVGELVLTHNNRWRKVTETFENPNTGNLKEMSVAGLPHKLKITGNHRVYAVNKKTLGSKDKKRSVRELLAMTKQDVVPEFIAVEDLKVGDLLCYPINDEIENLSAIDISKYSTNDDTVDENSVSIKYGHTYPRYINIDKELCRFVGLFAADGGVQTPQRQLKITSASHEFDNHRLANEMFSKLGDKEIHVRKYSDRNAIDHILCSRIHTEVFKDWFYTNKEKKLPDWSMKLPIELQKEIIVGLFMGDGHYCKDKDYSVFHTTSKILYQQIIDILMRCRIQFGSNLTKRKSPRKDIYSIEVYGCNIKDGKFPTKINGSAVIYLGRNCYRRIRSIKNISENVPYVYNLEVEEDNSYISQLGGMHNCEGFGVPQIEAISCGLPLFTVDYSAMSEVGEKSGGYRVPVTHKFLELETGAFRVYPDNNYAAKKLYEHFRLPEPIRARRGFQSRQVAETIYNWDVVAEKWDKHFDTIELNDGAGWSSSGQIYNVPTEHVDVDRMSNEEFVRFIAYDVLNNPAFEFSHKALGIIRSLNYGVQLDGNKIVPVSKREIYDRYRGYALSKIYAEKLRLGEIPMPKLDFIEAA